MAEIAHDALHALVARNFDAGLNGLYVGGSTGEAFLMSVDEREILLKATAKAANRRGTLIAHVGDLNPKVSAHLARFLCESWLSRNLCCPTILLSLQHR